ncbi:MAG TPA: MerR family transcriptional regulator [Candidatus Limnocylindrales bacterium]|nr:MerR family transcriptional regulator [Candidatus Limnocylindrales bacterium]
MTLTTAHRAGTAPANAAAAPANAATAPANPAADRSSEPSTDHLLRIQEVSEEVGLTPRSIRYYEERGLLKPAARSEGAYRLYDTDDIERLRFIKGLRDDAGFSLSDIGQLLEDESARARIRARYRETTDRGERRALLIDGIARIDRQVASLRSKIERLQAMVDAAATRRGHLQDHIDELDGKIATVPGHEPDEAAAGRATSGPTTTRRTAR